MGSKLSISEVEKKIFEKISKQREINESIDRENLEIVAKQMEWMKRQNRIFERTTQTFSSQDSPDPGGFIPRGDNFNRILRRSSVDEQDQEYEARLVGGEVVKIKESELISRINSGEDWRINVNSSIKIGTRLGNEYIYAQPNQYTKDNLLNLTKY